MGRAPDATTVHLEDKRALLEKPGVPKRASQHLAEWIDKLAFSLRQEVLIQPCESSSRPFTMEHGFASPETSLTP
eukprot:7324944-Pyramimonas_sp.AAC.1